MANKFGEKVTGSVAFSGVSGVDVVSLGSGTSDELRPCRPNSTRDDISLTQSWPANLPSYEQMFHENFNTAHDGDDAGKIFMSTKAKFYETGDLVVYYLTNTNFNSGEMPGLNVRTPYYAIRIDDQNIGLATTYANALAGTRITFDGPRNNINASNHTIVAVKHLCMIKNALFDYNNQYPAFGQWNANPNYTVITQNGNALNALWNGSYDINNQYLAQWRHYGAIQMPNAGWMSSAVQTFQQNDAPYKDSGVGTGNQARIISMGGPGTIYPLGVGLQINDSGLYSHYKSSYEATATQAGVALTGNANLWAMHQWQQDQFFVSHYMRAGGKIRFGAKIRVSEEDMIQDNNFGGVYVHLAYSADTTGHTGSGTIRNHIESITVKKRDTNLDLPNGQINASPASVHTFRNDGLHPKVTIANDQYDPPHPYYGNTNLTVNHHYVNVEDHADFKEVVVEFDVPSDYSDSALTTHFEPFYMGENGNSTKMTLAMQFSENGSYIDNQANDNDRLINASQISRNEPYTIIENKSGVDNSTMLTQDELHSIMATSADDYPIESSEMMQVGGIYTIVTTGTENWGNISADVFGKSDQNLVSDYDILNGDNAGVGFCFKVKTIGSLNGTGTVRRGGYHEGMDILPKNTSTVAKGKFVRRSGSVQIYSPFLEYIAPDQP